MEPNFGVGIKRYLFDNAKSNIQSRITQRLNNQIATYLPVVSINDIQFEISPDTNSLRMVIEYQIPTVGINDLLDITI